MNPSTYLGIDIGSVTMSMVLMDEQKKILYADYGFHHGNIYQFLSQKLAEIDCSQVVQIGHNYRSSDFFSDGISINDQLATIEGILYQHEKPGSAFAIGGETFGLILFDDQHQYQKYISNSSCAAGTGAFLDQQAERLGLSGSAELSSLAASFQGIPPKIATRCAVFAKTDLIHCQQQGYSIEAISDGLCQGLAHNIYDTLMKGVVLREPVIAAGGVSKNPRVMHYLSDLVGCPLVIPEYSALSGAIGCAVIALNKSIDQPHDRPISIHDLLKKQTQEKRYFYGPLSSKKTACPDFSAHPHALIHNVEVDSYTLSLQQGQVPAYLGIDIGSTSTKAVVMDTGQPEHILFGLYTRTAGQPIQAVQKLLRALREIEEQHGIQFEFQSVGTTGSGRKFIQKVINADLAIDEISAHARAAYALNPAVDTIIEIGGQDSKFTVMKNGHVVFSVMNYVCAAGTGSFIEEQARRLKVPLNEVAGHAIGSPSPLTSDRCTVFMERDLNHYLSQGYSSEELLAAALHSVADNYLSKVAHLNKIGKVICFQGATAKNEALVAVFEEKLQKPIFVSQYCHLTGALGVCLLLKDKDIKDTHFRGIDFYQETPTVTEEGCDLCTNHCKLTRVQVMDDSLLWGFLCGRDESDHRRKSTNQSGFDLLSSHRKIFNPKINLKAEPAAVSDTMPKPNLPTIKAPNFDLSLGKVRENLDLSLLNLRHTLFTIRQTDIQEKLGKHSVTIGIPNTLYNLELVPFWQFFFTKLGYRTYLPSSKDHLIEEGRAIAGAEFCTPISYFHGHVQDLSNHADYLFLPQMLEQKDINVRKFYCYYSNYAVTLVQNMRHLKPDNRCITPIIDFSSPAVHNIQQIYETLPQELKNLQTPNEMMEAYEEAQNWFLSRKELLSQVYQQQSQSSDDISMVLLGRPYLIFDPVLNKNIPEKFNQLGVKTFSQDMLPLIENEAEGPAREFLAWNHWNYGNQILKAVEYIGKTKGLYPVYLSAFKCSPDSFVINYFKEIMDMYQKPYLILQLDEHGSDIGYGTRVESAVEAFRNHYHRSVPVCVDTTQAEDQPVSFKQKTILIPSYDPLCSDLVCAAFERAGYQVCRIDETPTTVQSSLRLNDGQCLPISTIVQGAIETIQKQQIRPEDSAIFLNAISQVACNFPQYPFLAKRLLSQRGDGFEKVQVFATESSLTGFPIELIYDIYCANLLGGLLRKIGCKLRPYEKLAGQTDRMLVSAHQRLYHCIANGGVKDAIFAEIVADFSRIPLMENPAPRPKVAILGDIYIQDNDIFNQKLIVDLESYGAEVITVPITYAVRLWAEKSNYALNKDGRVLPLLQNKLLAEAAGRFETHYYQIAKPILSEEVPTFDGLVPDRLKQYNLTLKHDGETAENVLKVFSLCKHYPDISLFVHVNPIFCCPGLVSEAIFKTVEKDIGIPIVSIIYDGTTTEKNQILAPYMHYIIQSFSR